VITSTLIGSAPLAARKLKREIKTARKLLANILIDENMGMIMVRN
jgi:hypothetical protein